MAKRTSLADATKAALEAVDQSQSQPQLDIAADDEEADAYAAEEPVAEPEALPESPPEPPVAQAAPSAPQEVKGSVSAPQEKAAQAAQEVSKQADDIWKEIEEVVYTDDDGSQVPVRVPKSLAKKVRNAYARQSVMSRATGYLGEARAELEPLITSGQWRTIAPLVRLAFANPQFAQRVSQLASRAMAGLPLEEPVPSQTQAQPSPSTPSLETPEEDVLGVAPVLERRLGPLEERLKKLAEAQEQARQEAERQAQWRALAAQGSNAAYALMRTRYPDEFDGSEADNARMTALWNHASANGYIEFCGADRDPTRLPIAIQMAKNDLDLARLRDMVSTQTAPSEATLRAVQAAAERSSQEAARALAAAAGGGSPSSPAAAPARRVAIPTVDERGRRKTATQYARELLRAQEEAAG